MCPTIPTAALDVVLATQYRATGNSTLAAVSLASALDKAQAAHKDWEAENGPDPDWRLWYARYLLGLDVTPTNIATVVGGVPAQVEGYGVAADKWPHPTAEDVASGWSR